MKFKYTGQLPIKSADLVLAGIFKGTDVIKQGTVFEVPDDDAILIQRVKLAGHYEEVPNNSKSLLNNLKKDKKGKEKEE